MNIEYNLTFNNVEYILYLSTNETNLSISLEQANETLYWSGVFDGRYLEEITNKAGSFKSFEVFVKMLMSGLANETESVLVDLLSYKDLEMMRNKKNNNSNSNNNLNESNSMNTDLSIINKKYLIISYQNEFEKVHYPLPLSFILQPEVSFTLRTIERIKKLNQKLQMSSNNINNNINNSFSANSNTIINYKELEEIKNENQNLKNKIKLLESQRKLGAVENDEFLRNYTGIKEEYESYKGQSEAKIKLLAKTVEDLKLKINYNIDSQAITEDTNQSSKNEKLLRTITDLENKLEKAEEIVIKERKTAQQYIEEKNREVEKIKKEIFFMKESEKKLKVKINQLEKDLEIANKRSNYANNTKTKSVTKSVKSNYSYKSSVKSSSSKSNYSKDSVNSKASNPYDKFKGLYNKNYQPFNFFNKNKSSIKSGSVKTGSYAGSSKGSVVSAASANRSNASLSTGKKTANSKLSNNKTNLTNKNYLNTNKNIYSNIKSSNYNSSVNKISNSKNTNNQYNIYSSGKGGNPYLQNNILNKNKITNKTNINNTKSIKDNANILLDKQKILGEIKNSANAATDLTNPNNISIRSNAASKASNNQKVLDNINLVNPDEINARLGRIQQLLDTAKI